MLAGTGDFINTNKGTNEDATERMRPLATFSLGKRRPIENKDHCVYGISFWRLRTPSFILRCRPNLNEVQAPVATATCPRYLLAVVEQDQISFAPHGGQDRLARIIAYISSDDTNPSAHREFRDHSGPALRGARLRAVCANIELAHSNGSLHLFVGATCIAGSGRLCPLPTLGREQSWRRNNASHNR